MSTWQIFSDAGNSFRWQCSHVKLSSEPQKTLIEKPSSPHDLPSISDLLVQGFSKLYEDQSDEIATPQAFQTGLGKPVVVKQSSLVKASSIFGDQDDEATVLSKTNQSGEIETPPTFRTGLGKPVVVKHASLVKASSILGDQDDGSNFLSKSGYSKLYENQSGEIKTPPSFRTGLGKPVAVNESSLVQASSILGDQDDAATVGYSKLHENQSGNFETPPTFRTGLGKPVVVKQPSLVKASSILGDQDDAAAVLSKSGYSKLYENPSGEIKTPPSFRTGLGKPVLVKQSSLVQAPSILRDQDDGATVGYSKLHEDQSGESETPPTFQTGLGKPVFVKQSSLVKASSILGDEDDRASFLSKSGYSKLHENQNGEIETPPTFRTGLGKPVVVKQSSSVKASSILGDQNGGATVLPKSGYSKSYGNQSDEGETPPTFRTGLGKLVAVKQSSLVKASSILGDQDDGATTDTGSVNSKLVGTPFTFRTGSGKPVAVNESSLVQASSILGDQDDAATVGYSKLHENQSGNFETPPTFRTGLGKPVVVKQPSLVKASSILGDQDDAAAVLSKSGYSKLYENPSGEIKTPPSFRTGLGKPVLVKQSSLVQAPSILRDQDDGATVGYSKLHEDQSGESETPPTFQTGLGKPVFVKQSSLVKASSILGDEDDRASFLSKSGYSKLHENQNGEIETPPTFRTGLGKPVVVKQSSSVKASSILGDQNGGATVLPKSGYSKSYGNQSDEGETPPTFRTGLGKLVAVKQSSLVKASSILGDQDDGATTDTGSVNSKLVGTPFTFRTGSGKPVAINQSSMEKALSMFGCQDDDAFVDTGCVTEDNNGQAQTPLTFQTGSGKLVATKKSSLERALSILGDQDDDAFSGVDWAGGSVGRDDGTTCSNSMFQTGSGKAVNISSTGLIKARTLLGMEENYDHNEASKGFERHANAGEIKEVARGSIRSTSRPPPIKFQTAGGRSVKVSGDALKRARTLLGDPDLGNFLKEGDACYPAFSSNKKLGKSMLNKENNMCNSSSDDVPKMKQKSNNFISPVKSILSDKKTTSRLENIGLRSNLIKEFDAAEHDITVKQYNLIPSLNGPLVDISNTIGLNGTGEKRKPSSRIYPSPFKKPRNSKFVPPLNKKSTVVSNGTMPKMPEGSCCKKRVSTRYPFQFPRKYVKEYFEEPPSFHDTFENWPEWLRKINAENADKHTFEDESGSKCIGVDFFCHMLAQSGCSTLSKEWVANHYRWIVWKLACYQRGYPAKFCGKLLTVSNVLEELKYRYEREFNNGHRSALKRILEGDAPPSSHLVLCIASIQLKCNEEPDAKASSTSNATETSTVTSVELTDGWYSVKGLLDDLLLKQLVAGKLFVGQKLRICGAGLSGWNAPVSPLEASSMISLCLHINGAYKAHWAERLGFCKCECVPLALKCIKGSGGVVPSTLVGVTRIYPVLYREKLSDGGFVVRSERMESKRIQLYDYRRSSIVEGVMSEFQRGFKSFQSGNEQNSGDEGEKISLLLEKAAEPEVLMAEMSSEQLTSFATYQAKIEASRQSEMQKSINKALEEAGLSRNEVNTLMRVRVVGLTSKTHIHKTSPQQGLITIWNPTEKEQSELVEGQAYTVTGLTPINSDSCTIYLRARGSINKWRPLSPSSTQHYLPFFSPRKPISLSKMGEVPISSEFDVAAFVVYVGEVHKFGHEKRQWVFVADGTSISVSHELSDSLLAISFFSPSLDCDSIVPINYNLVGSTVGFCNLMKRAKDQMNRIWVAEATENSTYFLSYDGGNSKHLKEAAASADRWAKASTLIIEKLKGKISSVVARNV